MAKRILFTWNVRHEERALVVVERYVRQLLEQGDVCLIALQESPDAAEELQNRTGAHATGNGDIVLLSSEPFLQIELHNRFVMGVIRLGGSDVAIFNYHGHSRMEQVPDEGRGGFASEYRWVFDHLAGTRDVVVLGDFNAQPINPEISHRACFSFHSTQENPHARTLQSHQRPRKDMRFIAPPEATYIYGTGEGAIQKLVYDYLAASAHIAHQLSHVEVVKELVGSPLGSNDGRPTLSDHFPVRVGWVY